MAPKHSAKTAVHVIERSQLNRRKIQRELMGDDIDLEQLVVYLRSRFQFDVAERVVDLTVSRDIEQASTIKLTVDDYDRSLLHSHRLHNSLDVQIDGMWFRLVKVERSPGADQMDLTFEQREIAILRTYPKPHTPHNGVIFADRSQVTRAEFILRLIREVKEFGKAIPVVIPELAFTQEIEKAADAPTWGKASDGAAAAGGGVPTDYNVLTESDQNTSPQRVASHQLSVKGATASADQIRNCNTIIATGISMGVKRKLLVAAVMVATVESTLHNLAGGDRDSVGLFQQRASWGSYQARHDPAASSKLFYRAAVEKERFEPTMPLHKLCSDIQRDYTWNTSQMGSNYAKYEDEAKRWVTAYGVPGLMHEGSAASANLMGDTSGGGSDYVYYRGTPKENDKVWKREDSWTCIRRLADEVQWRAFFISGVFYFMSDDDLYKTQPIMIFDESTPGVEGVGFDIDIGKKTSELTINARVGSWLAPPGAVVLAKNLGPANGRWLVTSFERSLFREDPATITVIKPQAELPEPLDDNVQTLPSWANVDPKTGDVPSSVPQQAGWAGITTDGSANAIVQVAEFAYQEEQKNHYAYLQKRPYPATLFSAEAHAGIDCSAFATLCYREAGADDPNDADYNGTGNTGTLVRHGKAVFSPQPGDLVFYGGSPVYPAHVAVYVGGGKVIEIGSQQGILKIAWNYRPVIAVRRYVGAAL
jgi:cell wall-associated NlpC family hydrolase